VQESVNEYRFMTQDNLVGWDVPTAEVCCLYNYPRYRAILHCRT